MSDFTTGAVALISAAIAGLAPGAAPAATSDTVEAARQDVARLDVAYQAAVKRNDWAAMDRIMHPDLALVLGDGTVVTRQELIEEARSGRYHFEQQDEDAGSQAVRVWGDTAVVTARLWIKGEAGGEAFDRRLWFSDTYVRTAQGWRYAFGQASMSLPAD